MRTLWFKGCYIEPILRGEKRDTVRRAARRNPIQPGDLLAATVGPRPAFATLRVIARETVLLSDLPAWRAEQVRRLYGDIAEPLERIVFEVVSPSRRRTRTKTS